ncbi:rod-binding protein [Dongia sp.]|uniref:rod-binding protein n=1 Tax=Dongia sp. TaxID=1977262 RepID=UPI0035B1CCA4
MIDPSLQATGPSLRQGPGMSTGPRDSAGIAKVAEDFESFFAGLVFDQMSSDIEPDPVTGGGEGEAMFKSLLNQEFGKAVGRSRSLGIADIVQKQLMQIQEVA